MGDPVRLAEFATGLLLFTLGACMWVTGQLAGRIRNYQGDPIDQEPDQLAGLFE